MITETNQLTTSRIHEIIEILENITQKAFELSKVNSDCIISISEKTEELEKYKNANSQLSEDLITTKDFYEKELTLLHEFYSKQNESSKGSLIEKIKEFSGLLEESKRIISNLEQENHELIISKRKLESNLQLLMRSHEELE